MHSKIAVCISGEIRTATNALPSFFRFFGIDIDVFIHCWEDGTHDIDQIKKMYRPIKMIVDRPKPSIHTRPFSSMLYSMMAANELKREMEVEIGHRYDIVVKTRFDLIFNPMLSFPRQKPDPRTITCLGMTDGFNNIDYSNKGIDDVVFWGDSIAMDVACETYLHFLKTCQPTMVLLESGLTVDPGNCFFSPGVLIYQSAIRRNVMFKHLPGYEFVILRNHAKHLDPIKDFPEIRNLCKGWKP